MAAARDIRGYKELLKVCLCTRATYVASSVCVRPYLGMRVYPHQPICIGIPRCLAVLP